MRFEQMRALGGWRTVSTSFLIGLGLLVSATPAFANCEDGETKIRLGLTSDVDFSGRTRAANLLKDAVDRELQGKACVDLVVEDTAYKGSNAIAALQKGDVELIAPDFTTLGSYASGYQVFDLPFAFRDVFAVERFQKLAGVQLSSQLRSNGIRPLGFWHERFRQMTAKVALVVPKDAAGLKFRTDTSATARAMIDALKGTGQEIAENDLLIALKTGKVEAQLTTWEQLAEDKTITAQAGATETNHGFEGYQLIAASNWWDRLDPVLSKSLLEIIDRISRQTNFDDVRRQTNAKRSVVRSGAMVRTLTRQQRDQWIAAVEPLWSGFADQQLVGFLREADRAL